MENSKPVLIILPTWLMIFFIGYHFVCAAKALISLMLAPRRFKTCYKLKVHNTHLKGTSRTPPSVLGLGTFAVPHPSLLQASGISRFLDTSLQNRIWADHSTYSCFFMLSNLLWLQQLLHNLARILQFSFSMLSYRKKIPIVPKFVFYILCKILLTL